MNCLKRDESFFVLFFTRVEYVSCLRVCLGARLLPQSYQYPNLSEGADRVGGQLRGDKECPHTPSIAFRHLPPNSARFSYATLYLRAAAQRRGQRPPKGSGTNMTVEAT